MLGGVHQALVSGPGDPTKHEALQAVNGTQQTPIPWHSGLTWWVEGLCHK